MIFINGRLRFVVISGTLREGSSSHGALRRAVSAAEVELLDLREPGSPMYEPGRPLDDYMVHAVHALRGVVAPQMVTIGDTRKRFDSKGSLTHESTGSRLERLAMLVVMAEGLKRGPVNRDAEAVGVAL